MVQWFRLISWRLFDIWTSYFRIMSLYDLTFWPQNKYRSPWPIKYRSPWFCLISWRLFDTGTSHFGIMSVWPKVWPQNKCRSMWLCLISWRLFDVWTPYFGIMNQYNTTLDFKTSSPTWVQCAKVKSHFKKFKLIQALMLVLVTWKYQRIQSKTTEKKWKHNFPHYKVYGGIS